MCEGITNCTIQGKTGRISRTKARACSRTPNVSSSPPSICGARARGRVSWRSRAGCWAPAAEPLAAARRAGCQLQGEQGDPPGDLRRSMRARTCPAATFPRPPTSSGAPARQVQHVTYLIPLLGSSSGCAVCCANACAFLPASSNIPAEAFFAHRLCYLKFLHFCQTGFRPFCVALVSSDSTILSKFMSGQAKVQFKPLAKCYI